MTNTTTTTSQLLAEVVAAVVATTTPASENGAFVSENIVHAIALVIGLGIAGVGRLLPSLIAGNLVLSLFAGNMMRSSQEENTALHDWEYWPLIVSLICFIVMNIVLYFLKRMVAGVLSGLVFFTAALALLMMFTVTLLPLGLILAMLMFVLGVLSGVFFWDRPVFCEVFSAVLGGFLVVNSMTFYALGTDFFMHLTSQLMNTVHATKDERKRLAMEIIPAVAMWIVSSGVLFAGRRYAQKLRERYFPQKDDEENPKDVGLPETELYLPTTGEPTATELGRGNGI